MSSQSSAAAQLQTMSPPAEREPSHGFWRTMFDAWVASCARRGEDNVELDQRFHLAIAEASGNDYFRAILQHLGANIIPRARIDSARLTHADRVTYMEQVGREHEQIVDAIARGDAESARAAMRLHIGNSRERLRRAQDQLEAAQDLGAPRHRRLMS